MNRYNVNACENDSFRKTSFEMKKNSLVYFARGIAISLVRCLLNPVVFLRRKKKEKVRHSLSNVWKEKGGGGERSHKEAKLSEVE